MSPLGIIATDDIHNNIIMFICTHTTHSTLHVHTHSCHMKETAEVLKKELGLAGDGALEMPSSLQASSGGQR